MEKYIINVNLDNIKLSKNYNLSKKKLDKSKFLTKNALNVKEIDIKSEEVDQNRFSKNIHKLLTKKEDENIKLGLQMHSVFENFDFEKKEYSNLNAFEAKKVKAFINTKILNGAKKIYKEYEFIYNEQDVEYHGIIDLLIIKEKENIIVDYKLKDIMDKEYMSKRRYKSGDYRRKDTSKKGRLQGRDG